MGEILMFESRPRPNRSDAARNDAPTLAPSFAQSAEILFFMGVRYEAWVEPPPAPQLVAKPRKRTAGSPPPSGKPRKRPA